MPVWSTGDSRVKMTANMLLERKVLQQSEFDTLFNELITVKVYLKSQPMVNEKTVFDIWNEDNLPIEKRWLHISADLRKKSVSHSVFAKLVEYALMIPGKFQMKMNLFENNNNLHCCYLMYFYRY